MNGIEIQNAIVKGWQYIGNRNENGFFKCYIDTSHIISEIFESPPETSNMLIAEVLLKYHMQNNITKDVLNYLKEESKYELFTYFKNRNLYPPDSDVNSVGYSVLFESNIIDKNFANHILSILLSNTNEDGIVQVWLSNDDRPKNIDHVVATNIIYMAHLLNRENEVIKSIDWIYDILKTDKYLQGSRYYNSPNAFLFAISRIINKFKKIDNKFKEQLIRAVGYGLNNAQSPIDLAMLIIAGKYIEINTEKFAIKLLQMQNNDGSWQANALFRFGSQEKYFGSKALTTAYAVRALEI